MTMDGAAHLRAMVTVALGGPGVLRPRTRSRFEPPGSAHGEATVSADHSFSDAPGERERRTAPDPARGDLRAAGDRPGRPRPERPVETSTAGPVEARGFDHLQHTEGDAPTAHRRRSLAAEPPEQPGAPERSAPAALPPTVELATRAAAAQQPVVAGRPLQIPVAVDPPGLSASPEPAEVPVRPGRQAGVAAEKSRPAPDVSTAAGGVLSPPTVTPPWAAAAPQSSMEQLSHGVGPAASEVSVHVTIGRIEVRTPEPAREKSGRTTPRPGLLSLDDYGARRGRRP